ncbi:MAG: hypothetical protein EXR84_00830 [Gammaproteobacteria bacterium]|nr:hypothetical protein [Gammaproteobacteria bacterium]
MSCNAAIIVKPVSSQPLAVSIEQRRYQYRELFREALSPEDVHAFREATHYSMPIGSDYFRAQIERRLERSLGYMGSGRPRFGLIKE